MTKMGGRYNSPRLGFTSLVLVCMFMLMATAIHAIRVTAAGGTGSGGSGGGTSGDIYNVKNGYGWRLYDTLGGGPEGGFKDGTSWSAVVRPKCSGISQVAVFVVRKTAGGSIYRGYNYTGTYSSPISSPSPFISVDTARTKFFDLEPSYRAGYTWGSNVAWFCYGSAPAPKIWDAFGVTTVNVSEARPGDTVKFTHRINNVGSAAAPGIPWKTSTGKNSGKVPLAAGAGANVVVEGFIIPNSATLGKIYCQHVTFQNSQTNKNDENSANACVKVISNYDLYPSVTLNSSTNITPIFPGSQLSPTEIVYNNGLDAQRVSPYEVGQFVIKAGGSKPDLSGVFNMSKNVGTQSVQYAEGTYSGLGKACTSWLKSQSGLGGVVCQTIRADASTTFTSPSISFTDNPINADDYSPGDMICRFISVEYYKYDISDTSLHRISYPLCVVVAKQPSVQVWGGDMRVGDAVSPGVPNSNASVLTKYMQSGGHAYGSWVEYGIFAPATGKIESSSGGMLSGSAGYTGAPTVSALTKLSFANTVTPAGQWAPASQIASIEAKAAQITDNATVGAGTLQLDSLSGLADGSVTHITVTGDAKIQGKLPKAAAIVITVAGNAEITSDINLGVASYGAIGHASQIVIIARNIVVDPNVGNIDAWLVAVPASATSGDGKISTCGAIQAGKYFDGLRLGDECSKNALRINGVVMAKELQLRRTNGAENTSLGVPAETINLRADAYVWGGRLAAGSGGTGMPITTIFTHELPPRF